MGEATKEVFQKIATEKVYPRKAGGPLSRRNVLRASAVAATGLAVGGAALGAAELSKAMHNEIFEAGLRNGHGWVSRRISIPPNVPLRSSRRITEPDEEPNVEVDRGKHGWIILEKALITRGNSVGPAEDRRFADESRNLRLDEAWVDFKYKGFWVTANLWAIVDEALKTNPAARNDLNLVYGEIKQTHAGFELIPVSSSYGNQRPILLSVDVN